MSASPFRASVKVDQHFGTNEQGENSDDDFVRDETLKDASPMMLRRNRKVSPIRGDSEEKRESKAEFLSSFIMPPPSMYHSQNRSALPIIPQLSSEPGNMIQQILGQNQSPHSVLKPRRVNSLHSVQDNIQRANLVDEVPNFQIALDDEIYAMESSIGGVNDHEMPDEAKYIAYGMVRDRPSKARQQSSKLRDELERKLNGFGNQKQAV